jgi:DNA sulfur modification protein DndE
VADRLFTSSAGEATLSRLRAATRLEFASLARVALCLSIKRHGAEVPASLDFSGKEIRDRSLFGSDEVLYRSIVQMVYGRQFSNEDEFLSKRSLVKDHVDSGLALMQQQFDDCGQDVAKFLGWLAAEAHVPDRSTWTGTVQPLSLTVGREPRTGDPAILALNNTLLHPNFHVAMMGKPGVGKTQLLLKMLADIRDQSGFRTNFILFDYKGDVASNGRFVDVTRAETFQLPSQQLPINPFVLEDYTSTQVHISAREKAESFASAGSRFGPVQRGALNQAILRAYEQRSQQTRAFPDFRELFEIVQVQYAEAGKKDDTLIEMLRDFASFHLFWEHGSAVPLVEHLTERTFIVDLHELPVLKELVAYLVVERLYKEASALPDSRIDNGLRLIRTVLVIDEAHNYLPQKNLFLQKIIREGRSKGIAVFLASQSPDDYLQKFFNFRELLEFSLIFQCDGMSVAGVRDLLGCGPRAAGEIAQEIARLKPFEVVSKPLLADKQRTRFRAEPFFQAYGD